MWNSITQASSAARRHHGRVLRVQPDDDFAAQVHQRADGAGHAHAEDDAVPREPACVGHVARTHALRHQRAGRAGQRHRQHEQHRHQVGRDLVPGHRVRAHAGDEHRHQRKPLTSIRIVMPIGTPSFSWVHSAPVGAVQAPAPQLEGRVEGVAAQHAPGDQRLRPHHQRGGQRTAHHPQRRQAQPGQAVDQQRRQRHLQQQAADLQRHHRLGPRHRVVEAAVGREQQRRRQRQRQHAQVVAHAGFVLGRHAGQGHEGLREQQQGRAQQRQAQRQPHRLVQLLAGVDQLARAEQLPGDGPERDDHAHQPDEDGDVGRAADGQRRQVLRRMATQQHRVDGGERHHRQLAHEDRPGLGADAPAVLQEVAAQRRLPGGGAASIGGPAVGGALGVAVEAPGRAVLRDAAPHGALVAGAECRSSA
jgi:hypothetical protein